MWTMDFNNIFYDLKLGLSRKEMERAWLWLDGNRKLSDGLIKEFLKVLPKCLHLEQEGSFNPALVRQEDE